MGACSECDTCIVLIHWALDAQCRHAFKWPVGTCPVTPPVAQSCQQVQLAAARLKKTWQRRIMCASGSYACTSWLYAFLFVVHVFIPVVETKASPWAFRGTGSARVYPKEISMEYAICNTQYAICNTQCIARHLQCNLHTMDISMDMHSAICTRWNIYINRYALTATCLYLLCEMARYIEMRRYHTILQNL